jgi:hypothetical protein
MKINFGMNRNDLKSVTFFIFIFVFVFVFRFSFFSFVHFCRHQIWSSFDGLTILFHFSSYLIFVKVDLSVHFSDLVVG